MQTCLEKRGMEKRHEALLRNDYTANDPYNAEHPDAISDGDIQGKGTGHGGHGHWLPDCTKANETVNMIDYSNFDTKNGGGRYDIEGRNGVGGRDRLKAFSMYNENEQYGLDLVDTSKNIRDGQVYFNQFEQRESMDSRRQG